ncbi:hypothetical protein NSK11_contig00304-0001 [Nocardia seriolae]|uniref:Uncharacterized protein n=1 Tax=Nocardia seriolae TaxID=37332 RepID=A0ABC9Z6L2_9NOCA|nr:hypothetical protein NSK11_contig00304-0001 [Nocardia seriolae]
MRASFASIDVAQSVPSRLQSSVITAQGRFPLPKDRSGGTRSERRANR